LRRHRFRMIVAVALFLDAALVAPSANSIAAEATETTDSFRSSTCRFNVYFDAGQSRLTNSARAELLEAVRLARSNGTDSIQIRYVVDGYRDADAPALVQDRRTKLMAALSESEPLNISYKDMQIADVSITPWYYMIDICDAQLRARRQAIVPPTDTPPLQYGIGTEHLSMPLRYFPEFWADTPLITTRYDSLYVKTSWPEFHDGADPVVASCTPADVSQQDRCSGLITVGIFAIHKAEGLSPIDPPPTHDLIDSNTHLYGGKLFFYRLWPKYPLIVVDFAALGGPRSDLACTLPHGMEGPPSGRFPAVNVLAETVPSASINCQFRVFLPNTSLKLLVYVRGKYASQWQDIRQAVTHFVSSMITTHAH
jgi:hypothetical protein